MGHTSDPPTSWADFQVLAFVQSWTTLLGIFPPASYFHGKPTGSLPPGPANNFHLANIHVIATCSQNGVMHVASIISPNLHENTSQ